MRWRLHNARRRTRSTCLLVIYHAGDSSDPIHCNGYAGPDAPFCGACDGRHWEMDTVRSGYTEVTQQLRRDRSNEIEKQITSQNFLDGVFTYRQYLVISVLLEAAENGKPVDVWTAIEATHSVAIEHPEWDLDEEKPWKEWVESMKEEQIAPGISMIGFESADEAFNYMNDAELQSIQNALDEQWRIDWGAYVLRVVDELWIFGHIFSYQELIAETVADGEAGRGGHLRAPDPRGVLPPWLPLRTLVLPGVPGGRVRLGPVGRAVGEISRGRLQPGSSRGLATR